MGSPGRSGPVSGSASPPAAPESIGVKPASRNIELTRSDVAESMPLSISGVAIGRSSAPICEPADAGRPNDCTSAGRSANGRDARVVRADGGGETLRRDGQLEPRLRGPRAARPCPPSPRSSRRSA